MSVPGMKIHQCYIKREKRGLFGSYFYQLFGKDNEPILSAKTESSLFSTKFTIFEPIGGSIIGKIESDSKSIHYKVKGPNIEYSVDYNENFLGRLGPRNFKLYLNSHLYQEKAPIVINGDFYQDFHDMPSIPSIKNFVCVDSCDFAKEVCVFVKSSEDVFTLRVSEPFSLFIGFTLALTDLHTGLYHR